MPLNLASTIAKHMLPKGKLFLKRHSHEGGLCDQYTWSFKAITT
jgi:hypothetical protein